VQIGYERGTSLHGACEYLAGARGQRVSSGHPAQRHRHYHRALAPLRRSDPESDDVAVTHALAQAGKLMDFETVVIWSSAKVKTGFHAGSWAWVLLTEATHLFTLKRRSMLVLM